MTLSPKEGIYNHSRKETTMGFYCCWLISAVILLLFAACAGRKAKFTALSKQSTIFGILIDSRERYSLNRFQLVMWTILILSTFLGLLFSNLFSDPIVALSIPNELLGLLGISAGSATVACAVKDYKNTTRAEKITGGEGFHSSRGHATGTTYEQNPSFVQIFLEEEGTQGDNKIVSITKFQNFIFAVALGVIYVVLTIKARGYPVLHEKVLWLIGISHASYFGGKLPDKD